MYCVIQEREIQKANKYGNSKEIIENNTTDTFQGKPSIFYNFKLSDEKFIRPIKKTYKISIHESYREHGVVKKNQWAICTMDYYSIAEDTTWIQDFMKLSRWDKLLKDMDMNEDELCNMVDKKLDPLTLKIKHEYRTTEEYITSKKHADIVGKCKEAENSFVLKYANNGYHHCFDIFGVLRNKELLDKIKSDYEAEGSYQGNKQGNYNYDDFSSYLGIKQSTYNEEDKKNFKKFYKTLAMKFHPDICNDNGEAMKLLNQLKIEWKI